MEKEIYLDFTLLEVLEEEEKNRLNKELANNLPKDVDLKLLKDKNHLIDLKLLKGNDE